MALASNHFDDLAQHAEAMATYAHTPYSGTPQAYVLLLTDGQWIPGVRVESASYPLTISAVLNAVTTAFALRRTDVVALACAAPIDDFSWQYLLHALPGPWRRRSSTMAIRTDASALPQVGSSLPPFLTAQPIQSVSDGIRLARAVAERAYIPASNFPVGCVLESGEGRLIPGVNVEHPDWSRILCAERNALGTMLSYGMRAVRSLYLSCPKDAHGTPCGACRQLLAEFAPMATIWMDRGRAHPQKTTAETLLPASFSGAALGHTRR